MDGSVERRNMMREVIGAWRIITNDGTVWFTDRLKGELLETAIAAASATFGDGCAVEPW